MPQGVPDGSLHAAAPDEDHPKAVIPRGKRHGGLDENVMPLHDSQAGDHADQDHPLTSA